VVHLGPGHALEQLAGEMNGRAIAGRGVVELARIGFRVVDQVLHGLDLGQLLLHHQDIGQVRDLRDRDEVLLGIVGELGIEILVDRDLRRHDEQRRAVGRALGDAVHADIGGRTRDVLDDDARMPQRGEAIGDDAPDDVSGATGGIRDDQFERTEAGGKGALGQGRPRQKRQRRCGEAFEIVRRDTFIIVCLSFLARPKRCMSRLLAARVQRRS
jgi:hypothetical protein